jgi:hypothetical protein
MIFLAPIAAAGYIYWDKKRKEKLANENGESDDQPDCDKLTREETSGRSSSLEETSEEVNWDMVGGSASTNDKAEDALSVNITEGGQADTNHETHVGPMSRWNKFRTNLQKEFAKAEARKAREAAMRAEMAQLQQVQDKTTLGPTSGSNKNIPAIESQ